MKKSSKNDYVINFKGLETGKHFFEYDLGDKFFEFVDAQGFEKGEVKVQLELIKESTMLVLNFKLKGSVELECDRCLDEYDQKLEGDFRLIVKFGEEEKELSDEIIVIPHESYRLDISHYLYEYVALLLPLKHVHPDDELGNSTCNSDMLERLDSFKVKNDTRWDALKNIKLD